MTDWTTIYGLRHRNPEDTLREIAEHLRSGEADQRFLDALADHLDPDKVTGFGVKLVAKQPGKGSPKARPNTELQTFMQRHVDFFGEDFEATVEAAKAKYGVGRTSCTDALAAARKRSERDPELAEMHRRTALSLREGGHPDCQPL